MRLAFVILVGVSVISGCNSPPPPAMPLSLPEASDVARIEASSSDDSSHVSVTDSQRISEVLEVVGRLNHDMERPFSTFPAPTHSVIFYGHDDMRLLILFVGLNWLGDGIQLTSISEPDRSDLLAVIDVADYRLNLAE